MDKVHKIGALDVSRKTLTKFNALDANNVYSSRVHPTDRETGNKYKDKDKAFIVYPQQDNHTGVRAAEYNDLCNSAIPTL